MGKCSGRDFPKAMQQSQRDKGKQVQVRNCSGSGHFTHFECLPVNKTMTRDFLIRLYIMQNVGKVVSGNRIDYKSVSFLVERLFHC